MEEHLQMQPVRNSSNAVSFDKDSKSIEDLLRMELLLLRYQGMRLKSIRKSKLEIFYLMYQMFIVGLFAVEACAIPYHYEASRTFDPETVTKILNCSSFLQAALSTVTFMYGIKKHLKSALCKWETYRHNYNGIPDSVIQKYIRNFIITYSVIFTFCSLFIMSYYTLFQPVIITFTVDRFLTESE